jgi:hypothetical protein
LESCRSQPSSASSGDKARSIPFSMPPLSVRCERRLCTDGRDWHRECRVGTFRRGGRRERSIRGAAAGQVSNSMGTLSRRKRAMAMSELCYGAVAAAGAWVRLERDHVTQSANWMFHPGNLIRSDSPHGTTLHEAGRQQRQGQNFMIRALTRCLPCNSPGSRRYAADSQVRTNGLEPWRFMHHHHAKVA